MVVYVGRHRPRVAHEQEVVVRDLLRRLALEVLLPRHLGGRARRVGGGAVARVRGGGVALVVVVAAVVVVVGRFW